MKELSEIQAELKAPKNQKNAFGGYNYRSCEDILEALKPLLKEKNCFLKISDEIVLIGDRYYVKATAKITSAEGKSEETTAYARETLEKKGMDASQITGATSSYARKYALNGLFCIDDTKDADQEAPKTKADNSALDAEKRMRIAIVKDIKTKVNIPLDAKLADVTTEEQQAFTEAMKKYYNIVNINNCKGKELEEAFKKVGK